ncbi:MAG: chorismate mutase [Eggerthellaceae bacterium]|nr:chorismate mutase [Eggerthellaceae bacterium]
MPDENHARMEIEERRGRIDEIDRQLVALLNERAGESLAIRALKPYANMVLYDPAREDAIFERVASYSDGTLYDQGLREIYETLLKVMKENPAK